MDFKQIKTSENTLPQPLSLFHEGKWAQALPILRKLHAQHTESPEIAAALGICELFFSSPFETAEAGRVEHLETIADLICQGRTTGWPEVLACQALIEFLNERQSSPPKMPDTINNLVDACQHTQLFPLWSLTFQILAYYDQRWEIRNLLIKALENPSLKSSDGLRLILAEAQLESAFVMSDFESLLEDINVQNCLPLSSEVAHLWKQWLLGEFTLWNNGEFDSLEHVEISLANLLNKPVSCEDLYSQYERNRLNHRIALMLARCVLYKQDIKKTEKEIELAEKSNCSSWECLYFRGLLAWFQGEYQQAQVCFEKSLDKNPFQSRVRFELGMLLSLKDPSDGMTHLDAMPEVYDTVASWATILFHCGDKRDAFQKLEQLDRKEGPFSLRLIWPQARRSRISQGRKLRAHLAESQQDWSNALKYWDLSRQKDIFLSQKTKKNDTTERERDLINRTHRLYILGRHLRQNKSDGEEMHDKTIFPQFHKELGKLSIRFLLGDAMFYRALASEESMPDRAIRDWRSLLRQSAWMKKTQKINPDRLLYIGDRLLMAGLQKEAHKAYKSINLSCCSGLQERVLGSTLIVQHPVEATALLQKLEQTENVPSNNAFWLFLRGLCFLAKEQPDYEAAIPILDKAQHAGLPAMLEKPRKFLSAFQTSEYEGFREVCSFLEEEPKEDFPLTLLVSMEVLCQPKGIETLKKFKRAFGANWIDLCPIAPEHILGLKLQNDCQQFSYSSALDQIQKAEELGLPISNEWKVFLFASQAVHMGLSGDFDSAKKIQQQIMANIKGEKKKDKKDKEDEAYI